MKMSYYSFKKQQLLEQAKYQYHSGGGKKKELLNIIAKTERFWAKMQERGIETYQKKKKKQKLQIKEKDILWILV